MTSPLRSSARSPSLHHRTDSSPWMRLCRASCCMSPAIGGKGGKRFPTTLVMTRSARWFTQRLGMPAGGSSIAALTVLEHVDAPTAVLAYHALARGLPDLAFRWYKITDEQEGILLRVVYNAFIHRRKDDACSTKWDLRTGDWLALLSGVRSACAWRSTHAGSADCQSGGTTHDDRRSEPGGRLQALAVGARCTRGGASRGDRLRAGGARCRWVCDARHPA